MQKFFLGNDFINFIIIVRQSLLNKKLYRVTISLLKHRHLVIIATIQSNPSLKHLLEPLPQVIDTF